MDDVLTWLDHPTVAEQRFGKVGNTVLFIVGHDPTDGYMLAATSLLGPPGSADMFGLVGYYPTSTEAQQVAEEQVAHMLHDLDLVPRTRS